jgi:PAS domain-containing protein
MYASAPPVTSTIPRAERRLADLMLVLCVNPGRTCAQSDVMLARLRLCGIFELLTVGAWARALGYGPQELSGKSLRELMSLERPAGEIVAALLATDVAEPVDVTLRCKDERRKRLRFHRRFDADEQAIFVVADEVSAAGD